VSAPYAVLLVLHDKLCKTLPPGAAPELRRAAWLLFLVLREETRAYAMLPGLVQLLAAAALAAPPPGADCATEPGRAAAAAALCPESEATQRAVARAVERAHSVLAAHAAAGRVPTGPAFPPPEALSSLLADALAPRPRQQAPTLRPPALAHARARPVAHAHARPGAGKRGAAGAAPGPRGAPGGRSAARDARARRARGQRRRRGARARRRTLPCACPARCAAGDARARRPHARRRRVRAAADAADGPRE
jgi:hypothetical protein